MQEQQQQQYPDLGATPIRTDLLTPAFSSAHPLDAVALNALANGLRAGHADLQPGIQRGIGTVVPDVPDRGLRR
jgi:hypothetical protein